MYFVFENIAYSFIMYYYVYTLAAAGRQAAVTFQTLWSRISIGKLKKKNERKCGYSVWYKQFITHPFSIDIFWFVCLNVRKPHAFDASLFLANKIWLKEQK